RLDGVACRLAAADSPARWRTGRFEIHMKAALKKRTVTLLFIAGAVVAFFSVYVRTHLLVFNESFWTHAHCIKGGGLGLEGYAYEHGGVFPFHTNGYGDALVLVNDGWDAALTGPAYDIKVFERAAGTGV